MNITTQQILNDLRVLNEISQLRVKISKDKGKDIGFEKAADEWFFKYSTQWIKKNYLASVHPSSRKSRFADRRFIFAGA